MKRVYDLLRELEPERIIDNEVKTYLKEITQNERILKAFGDKPLKKYLDALKKEAEEQYSYLLSFPIKEDHKEPWYLLYDNNAVWTNDHIGYYLLPESKLSDPTAEHYDMEYASPDWIMGLYVKETDEYALYRLIDFVFYETWYFWHDSKLRLIMNDD